VTSSSVSNLTPPPHSPVKWRCTGIVLTPDGRMNANSACEVEARLWFDAREKGERILGLPRGAVEAVLANGNGKGRKA